MLLCFHLSTGLAIGQFYATEVVRAAEDAVTRDIEPTEEDSSGDIPPFVRDIMDRTLEPVDLNRAGREVLERELLLTDMQAYSLVAYRNTYGDLVSEYELQAIDGFDRRTILRILPFIAVDDRRKAGPVKLRQVMAYGKHEVILRVHRTILDKEDAGSPAAEAGEASLGSPERLLLRYAFTFRGRVRLGFTTEKDPGESCFRPVGKDSKGSAGPDYYSGYAFLADMGALKTFIAGDFEIRAGQGLVLQRGGSFSGTGDFSRPWISREGVSPHTGTEENRFYRGCAAVLGTKRLRLWLFFSSHRIDASFVEATSDEAGGILAKPQYSGYHRTPDEITGKNALGVTAHGCRLTYTGNRFRVGATMSHTVSEFMIEGSTGLRGLFEESTRIMVHGGFDYRYHIKGMDLFGEVAADKYGNPATVQGFSVSLHPSLAFSLVYRNFYPGYLGSMSNVIAAGEFSNEKGVFFGFNSDLPRQIRLSGYVSLFERPWLQYRTDRPSRGEEVMLLIETRPFSPVEVEIRMRTRGYQVNQPSYDGFVTPLMTGKRTYYRLQVRYACSDQWTLKNRVELVTHDRGGAKRKTGFLFTQDIQWRAENQRFAANLRYALFDTDSYDERIYAYEPDVRYAFSVPAYFYRGISLVTVAKVNVLPAVSLWLKASRTWHTARPRSVPGEGEGDAKTELKVQMIVRI